MNVWRRVLITVLLIACAVVIFHFLIGGSTVASLTPTGPTAAAEKNLIITMVLLMLIIVIPMLAILYTIAWRYRAGTPHANYEPDAKHGAWKEIILWMIPAALIAVLWVLTWQSAHALDPSEPLLRSGNQSYEGQALTIEVVALPWKWLFIYPAQNIATVNMIEFPVATPVHFELTADAPMSSFWIPSSVRRSMRWMRWRHSSTSWLRPRAILPAAIPRSTATDIQA